MSIETFGMSRINTHVGESFLLENGDIKIPVQPDESTELRIRTVGRVDVSAGILKPDQVLLQ